MLMAPLAATAYTEYWQVDQASSQLQDQSTVAGSFETRPQQRKLDYPKSNQPATTVRSVFVETEELVGLDAVLPSESALKWLFRPTTEHAGSMRGIMAYSKPDQEYELLVKMAPKSVRHVNVRIAARTKAGPNPVL